MQVRYYTGVLHFMQLIFFLKKLLINQIGKSNLLGELAVFNISSLNPFVKLSLQITVIQFISLVDWGFCVGFS